MSKYEQIEQMETKHVYWVNKMQILADNYVRKTIAEEKWILFQIQGMVVMGVRENQLFQLEINLPLGNDLYQDTMACEHLERHYPKQEGDVQGMVFLS